MSVLLIHLSDIHFREDVVNPLVARTKEFVNAVRNRVKDSDVTIIAVSGDIAFSGGTGDYTIAQHFFEIILHDLEEYTKKYITLVFVPGNHDCSISDGGGVRDSLLDNLRSKVDLEIVKECTKCQEHFNKFKHENGAAPQLLSPLMDVHRLDVGSHTIMIYGYNSAFCSQIEEKQGRLLFPLSLLDKNFFSSEANLSISIMHHPPIWMNSENARELKMHLEKTSDIILTGHEHTNSQYITDDLQGRQQLYVEGCVLQDNDHADVSGFNVIEIDLNNKSYKIDNYVHTEKGYLFNDNGIWHKFSVNLTSKLFNDHFSESHKKWLGDIGLNFTHPRKGDLNLSDLWIAPNLKVLLDASDSPYKEDAVDKIVSFDSLLNGLFIHTKNVFLGNEKAGKTTLCKQLISEARKKKMYPIYIKGRKIDSADLKEFRKLIKKSFNEQYDDELHASLEQISDDDVYLIIDNLDRANLNVRLKRKFIGNISESFKNVCITGGDLIMLQDIYADDPDDNSFNGYNQYVILEFGHRLRYELINKWNSLGRVDVISDEDITRINDDSARLITSIIGPNFIPSYPIFLLTFLQSIEAGSSHDLKESSYGYYYQALILSSLGKIVKANEDIENYYTYLSEFAYYLFLHRDSEISIDEMRRFHESHYNQYRVRMSFEDTIEKLSASALIEKYDTSICFKYKYIYYYFVGKYLADNIEDSEIKGIIKKMCRRLHDIQCANIILFLTHHSKHNFILNEIALVAKEQFSQFNATKLEEELKSLVALVDSIPVLTMDANDTAAYRREVLDGHDKKEDGLRVTTTKDIVIETLDDNGYEALDIISKLNAAFKTLEIIGQILKNHYASIKADKKLDLIEEAFLIGLRTLDSVFKIFADNDDYLVSQINQYIEKQIEKQNNSKKLDSQINTYDTVVERREIGNLIAFNMAYNLAFSFINKISNSVGTVKLKDLFPEVVKRHPFTSMKLIDFSIQLEYYSGFPMADLKNLMRELRPNHFASQIVKGMVRSYLYMYPVAIERRQQIAAEAGISIKSQRRIEGHSATKKRG